MNLLYLKTISKLTKLDQPVKNPQFSKFSDLMTKDKKSQTNQNQSFQPNPKQQKTIN